MSKRKYTEENLDAAVSAVRQNRMGLLKAAAEFHVPKSTLSDHIRGKYKKSAFGPNKQLTVEEENALVRYMLYMANQGFPLTRNMARCYIQDIVKQSGRKTLFNVEKGPSDKWFKKLIQKHSELSERKPENQDKARTAMSNKGVMERFFSFLKDVFVKYDVMNKPSQIFNCDETGWSGKEVAKAKVIGPKLGHVFRRRTTTTDHITAHLCVCADGRFLPTMVIFQGSFPHRSYRDGIPDSWFFGKSESGYMDTELFYRWFTELFIPNCGRVRPVVLLMDNHDSHISLNVVEKAIENDIVLVGFPGHTTHILQPLDVKVIGPLKSRFSETATNLGFTSGQMTIGKAKFPVVLKYVLDKTTPASVQEAFAATGICPFKPAAIDTSQLATPSFEPCSEEQAENEVRTCDKCGHFIVNPLVKRGLIPQTLADILIPAPVKPVGDVISKKKRVVSEGRLISGEDMLKQLKEKEEFELKKKEEAEMKRKEKEMRKEKKKLEEEEKLSKRIMRQTARDKKNDEKKKKDEEKKNKIEKSKKRPKIIKVNENGINAAILAASLYVCGVCGMHGMIDDESNGIMWFGCDEEMCGKCYHEACLSDAERELVHESLEEDGGVWYCIQCKPWLYEEE